jgi:hypothetical protein
MNQEQPHGKPALFIGIDWADKKHDIYVIEADGTGSHSQIESTPEAIEQWVIETKKQAGAAPIAIMLEQSRGALVHALMFREGVVLYPINPKQFSSYRESYSSAGGKSDPSDARLMARMLRERINILRAWTPDDDDTRLLARLCEQRRKLVDEHTRTRQQLISQLKLYFPQAFQLFGAKDKEELLLDILMRWPDPRKFKRANRQLISKLLNSHGIKKAEKQQEILDCIRDMTLLCKDEAIILPATITVKVLVSTLKQFTNAVKSLETEIELIMKKHPDASLFTELRGAGKAMAPRLLTAFGSQRSRWENADEIATFSGIAPITKQSGKLRHVHRRFACPKYLRQTFHEFADQARIWCPWSKAVYESLKAKGMKHHAALRKLARSWIRILFKVWKTRTPYDPGRYLNELLKKRPEIKKYLPAN